MHIQIKRCSLATPSLRRHDPDQVQWVDGQIASILSALREGLPKLLSVMSFSQISIDLLLLPDKCCPGI